MGNQKTEKYLRTRGITTPWKLEGDSRTDYRFAIVIPVLDEFTTLPETLESLAKNPPDLLSQTLIVIVINNRASAAIEQKIENQKTLDWLRSAHVPWLNLTWVDASSPSLELSQKDGVGLARKIGFDLALSCLDWSSDPLLISLDADSLVDENYLSAIGTHFHAGRSAGAFLPFRHQQATDSKHEGAIRRYELYLRSYLFGLQWAGSPYAFTSIGSALACRASCYVTAGGMKRRKAGEDFYFLQQLVKVGEVRMLNGTVVKPSSRFSVRVPFGTGRAVQAEVSGEESLYRFISSNSFQLLKIWLQLVADHRNAGADVLLAQAMKLSPALADFLVELDFADVWDKLHKNHSSASFLSEWHNWFDGLRTRQLLGRLEVLQPEIDAEKMIGKLLKVAGYSGYCCLNEQLRLLERLQGVSAVEEGVSDR